MGVYIYIYTCIYVYKYIIYIYVYLYIYVHGGVVGRDVRDEVRAVPYIYMYIFIHKYIYIYMCVYICTSISIYICIYIERPRWSGRTRRARLTRTPLSLPGWPLPLIAVGARAASLSTCA